jgi:GTP-binding protein YchF
MQVGIIGLPNAGKSTIFNALASAHAAVASYPFCTIEPNTGFVNVPDDSIVPLAKIFDSRKVTYAAIKIVDIAGLVSGASRGEGLGNKFLAHIREADVVAHVLRCFSNDNVSHFLNKMDPLRDVGIISTELILADIESLEKRKDKYISAVKANDSQAREYLEIIEYLINSLNNYKPDETTGLKKFFSGTLENFLQKNPVFFRELNLFCLKPVIYIANVSEDSRSQEIFNYFEENKAAENLIKIYGKLESELSEIPESERPAYRAGLGIEGDGISDFIKTCYGLLNLITFYTVNENEARAWSIRKDSKVVEAAGKIHSDMLEGFIKAEVINSDLLIGAGSIHKAREEGILKIEGKDYILQDRDVIQIKFSV